MEFCFERGEETGEVEFADCVQPMITINFNDLDSVHSLLAHNTVHRIREPGELYFLLVTQSRDASANCPKLEQKNSTGNFLKDLH